MPDWTAVTGLYHQVYREPPYGESEADVARFRETLAQHAELPGFALTAVHSGDVLDGFAYGVGREAGWWPSPAAAAPPPWLAGRPLFYVYELAVRPGRRGRGHGRDLLDRLLRDRAEPCALLAAATAAPAHALYRRWGWEAVGVFRPGVSELLARRL
ncbi:GNAT family N-acetyltransferase [Amycolatopsis sp. FBCC-B4732]|uniref:GNAT family N-acetyltransferase n=1 Tax=Amycolatopsis sp. FBCC-B4732 TaxID=3079339 RepID=UPI001FF57BF0|nr:GNAT family N-acetyltransferase [Amycolatopsis sp. FBCC-B4732]UOX91966.1 GNAT family N-acetyltransferase [Amycolatopsis sp. FBCC-B4732]